MLGKGLEALIPDSSGATGAGEPALVRSAPLSAPAQSDTATPTHSFSSDDSAMPEFVFLHAGGAGDVAAATDTPSVFQAADPVSVSTPVVSADLTEAPTLIDTVSSPAAGNSAVLASARFDPDLPHADVSDSVSDISAAPATDTSRVRDIGIVTPPLNQKFPDAIFHIEVSKIVPNPFQPRRYFDDEAIGDLAVSIREYGILQPLVVTKMVRETSAGTDVEYQLIAGERRLLAAKKLGLERVPAIIKSVDIERERLELAIIENLQRENLNAVEMARAFARLQDEFRLTQREIATRLGKSREVVANTMRLLDLPPMIQRAIEENKISESHGRMLLGVSDIAAQQRLFSDLLVHPMTIRELKARVKHTTDGAGDHDGGQAPGAQPRLKIFEERLSADLGAPVRISQSGDSGKIVINYYSKEELDQIIKKLRPPEFD